MAPARLGGGEKKKFAKFELRDDDDDDDDDVGDDDDDDDMTADNVTLVHNDCDFLTCLNFKFFSINQNI